MAFSQTYKATRMRTNFLTVQFLVEIPSGSKIKSLNVIECKVINSRMFVAYIPLTPKGETYLHIPANFPI